MKIRLPSMAEAGLGYENVIAEIVFGESLEIQPLWDIEYLSVTLPVDNPDSGYEWQDSVFQFDTETFKLQGLSVSHGDQLIDLSSQVDTWLSEKAYEGTLQLPNNPRHIEVDYMEYMWLDPSGDYLAGLYKSTSTASSKHVRLQIAPAFDLLFTETSLVGWLLWKPISHLSFEWEMNDDEPESDLLQLTQKFLEIIATERGVKSLQDKEEAMFMKLMEMYKATQAGKNTSNQRRALHRGVESILNRFYSHKERED